MHSLYSVKKRVEANYVANRISLHQDIPKIRTEEFIERTANLADKHRDKDRSIVQSKTGDYDSPRHAETIYNLAKDRHLWAVDEPLKKNVALHTFRDRDKAAELFHACISPSKYVPERARIAQSLEAETFQGVRWSTVWWVRIPQAHGVTCHNPYRQALFADSKRAHASKTIAALPCLLQDSPAERRPT